MSTVTDSARRELHQRAESTWGKEAAETLMAYLPPVGYADVATKSDIALLRAETEATESRLVARMEAHAAETAEKFAKVHEAIADVHEAIADVHKAISEVHALIGAQSRWFVIALSGTVIAVSALPQVVERLLP